MRLPISIKPIPYIVLLQSFPPYDAPIQPCVEARKRCATTLMHRDYLRFRDMIQTLGKKSSWYSIPP